MANSKRFRREIMDVLENDKDIIQDLRRCAFKYKDFGMTEDEMIENLEALRKEVDSEEKEDIILVLMDQVGGWCHRDLRIF